MDQNTINSPGMEISNFDIQRLSLTLQVTYTLLGLHAWEVDFVDEEVYERDYCLSVEDEGLRAHILLCPRQTPVQAEIAVVAACCELAMRTVTTTAYDLMRSSAMAVQEKFLAARMGYVDITSGGTVTPDLPTMHETALYRRIVRQTAMLMARAIYQTLIQPTLNAREAAIKEV